MAARASVLALHQVRNAHRTSTSSPAHGSKPAPPRGLTLPGRRQLALSLTWTAALAAAAAKEAKAEDIGLFGLRRKVKEAEKEAEVIVKEGFETVEKGLESAEKGLESAEKGIESVERGIETAEEGVEAALSFGGLAQAGAVAGAEVVGVLVATSIVNGILGPDS
ncbi:hypothetical protein D8674_013831 [Pyrus ussuriensis x Pyrus communis]|uniref:Uncharacterized protein n=1 Tax=Pyrus ussuriensis x Pyrus communis TaxID=2448454 RepID=A0A5N5GW91_9ROSA|nr:uncharacterized protein LOC103933931 [Pyrus x bretschneideri]KAB2617962.1 hypothetical protein D8674_013831 [Pyrus ussuriensis x Pyrus communis]